MSKRHCAGYVLRQMVRRYFADGVPQASAELAYFMLFSVFPLLMVLNSALGRIRLSDGLLDRMHTLLPSGVTQIVTGYLDYLGRMPSTRPMVIGIVLTVYFLSRAMRSLLHTIHRLYRVQVRASSVMQMLMALMLTVIFIGAIAASFALVVIGRTLSRLAHMYIQISPVLSQFAQMGGYLVAIALVLSFLLMINRIVPNVPLRWRNALPGTLFSLAAWVLLSMGFSFYVDNMANYSLLYGSLGAIMVLMLWLYLTGMVIIMGAQLNHILWSMHQVQHYEENGKTPG